MENKNGIIISGENYGQGSSREHAALAPMYLGIRAVIAKSFARIHRQNLINFGILPLKFANLNDCDKITQMDLIVIENVHNRLLNGENFIVLKNMTTNTEIEITHDMSQREIETALNGGRLNSIKLSQQ